MSQATFAHVGLTCNDPEAVERFYARHFGFRRVRVVKLADDQIVYTRSGDITLEIFRAKAPRPIPAPAQDGYPFPGWRHLAFQVDSLEAKLAEMGEDAHLTLGPLDFNDFIPNWRTAWLADPEGNIIEVSQSYTDQTPPPPLQDATPAR